MDGGGDEKGYEKARKTGERSWRREGELWRGEEVCKRTAKGEKAKAAD